MCKIPDRCRKWLLLKAIYIKILGYEAIYVKFIGLTFSIVCICFIRGAMALDSKELRKIWSGFQSARVLITANNLGVFDHIKRPQSADALSRAMATDIRATTLLLDALVSLGLLTKQSEKYRNTPLSARYLVKDSPEYQGDIIKHADILWQNWSALDEVVMAGRPAGRAFDYQTFIMGMHNIALLKVKDVTQAMKLKRVKKVDALSFARPKILAIDNDASASGYLRGLAKQIIQ